MPKMKTKRAAAKRFKATGTGKIKRFKASIAPLILAISIPHIFYLMICLLSQHFVHATYAVTLLLSSCVNSDRRIRDKA